MRFLEKVSDVHGFRLVECFAWFIHNDERIEFEKRCQTDGEMLPLPQIMRLNFKEICRYAAQISASITNVPLALDDKSNSLKLKNICMIWKFPLIFRGLTAVWRLFCVSQGTSFFTIAIYILLIRILMFKMAIFRPHSLLHVWNDEIQWERLALFRIWKS